MSKKENEKEKEINTELNIKCTIWEKETFELIDYYSNDIIQTKFKINTPGVISRSNKQISFIPGENLDKSPSDLITIKKNHSDGKYIIDSGNWSKELDKLIEEQGAFIVFRGLSFKEINNNISSRYYKLSQGDIIKIGRIYFKVLDIHTKRENVEAKSKVDSTIRGTMMRSSSCSNIIINGQEIIKGAFTTKSNKKQLVDLCLSGNAKLNQNNNDSLFALEKKSNHNMDNTMKNKESFIPKVGSSKELFYIAKKDPKSKNKNKEKEEQNYFKSKEKSQKVNNMKKKYKLKKEKDKDKEKDQEKNTKNKAICRICYGDDTSDENPLICPCICKGSMKYIHYDCLKNWLNSKIEEDISVDSENPEIEVISYNRKDISCELCKEKLPDYVKYKDRFYNISFYKPKFEEFFVLESMRADKHKAKFIHIISLDKKNSINIGRANECELSISELSVSRFHCIIHKDEGDLYLEDNSSKFGTLILIQNNNMIMNDFMPLRVQINKTFIKFKISLPFKFTCCKDPYTVESRKYDYQVQNRKCFDILSYFIIKENDANLEAEEEETINNNKKEELIDEDNNKKEEKNDEQDEENDNKELIDDKSSMKSEKKEEASENKSEVEGNDSKIHSSRIKKVSIIKDKNDGNGLPELDKIDIEQYKDNISVMAEKEMKENPQRNINSGRQSKTINLIRLNKGENHDKLNQNGEGNTNSNTRPAASSQTIHDDSLKNKKK